MLVISVMMDFHNGMVFFWSRIYRNTSSYAPFTCVTLDNMHFLIVPENTVQGLNHWSWKQTNVSFEAFLVGK